jgi:hypothetical protein
MKLLRVLAPALLLLGWAAAPASAGAPPIGAWVSARGAVLNVSDQATCTFIVPTARAEGDCKWRENATGGILLIQYQATTPTGTPRMEVLYLDIRWIDQTAITVLGELFRRTRW